MFSQACVKNSVGGGGFLCPSIYHRSHEQRAGSLSKGGISGGSLSREWGLCLGGAGSLSRGSVSMAGGVCVQGAGSLSGGAGSLSGGWGLCPGGRVSVWGQGLWPMGVSVRETPLVR